jgi:hypothetical protein
MPLSASSQLALLLKVAGSRERLNSDPVNITSDRGTRGSDHAALRAPSTTVIEWRFD